MAVPQAETAAVEPAAEAPLEPQHPYPPRFWWTKRLLPAILVVALLVTATRLWWGYYAQRRFDDAVAALRASGEPALAADLNQEPVSPGRNAVTYLNQAAAAVGPPWSYSNSNLSLGDLSPPYPQIWMDMAAASIEANAAAFPLLRQARQQPDIDWGLKFSSPVLAVMLPMLNNQRSLANTVADTALYLHFNGDDAEALRMIEDLFFQAHALEQQPILVSNLVGTGIRALALQRLQTIAAGLTIEDAAYPSDPRASAPATRQQVRDLIDLLLDERPQIEGFIRAMQGERVMYVDTVLWSTRQTWVTRPMFLLEAVHGMEAMYNRLIEAVGQPTLSLALAIVPTEDEIEALRRNTNRMLTSILLPSLNRVQITSFRGRAEQRMIAVALAIRIYHNDHGRYPDNLEELVPRYLPHVPADPIAPDDRPIGYILAANGTRPIVYHVDEDGLDNTSDESVLPTRPLFGWQAPQQIYGRSFPPNRNPVDQWRDVSAWQDPNPPPPVEEELDF